MNNPLSQLVPAEIWYYFNEVTQIPRPSKKEEKIIAYLESFAQKMGLSYKKDNVGNTLITKEATLGYENYPTIVLQSHVDMVCEKNNDVTFNFEEDAIQTYIDGEWLKAQGTTLGADNGIGIAAQLAILGSKSIEHGKIECLFTIDEETGLTGAKALQSGFFTGKQLINLDSEDEGELFVGCAGGIDTNIHFNYTTEEAPENFYYFRLDVKGLRGGHSGGDIHLGLANANKLLCSFLLSMTDEFEVVVSDIKGGNLRNVIPREAYVVAGVPFAMKERVRVMLNIFTPHVEDQFAGIESGIRFELETTDRPATIINKEVSKRVIEAMVACPHGVMAMSQEIEGLVETSTNLASIKLLPEQHIIEVVTSQRSSIEASKKEIAAEVNYVFTEAGATVFHGDGYPGWQPNLDSAILRTTKEAYIRLFGKEPKIMAIHAGLECGLFSEKYPGIDMVSFGPTMRAVHSPDERILIPTVDLFWKHLVEVLKSVK